MMSYKDHIEHQPDHQRVRIQRVYADGQQVVAMVTKEVWNNPQLRAEYMATRFDYLAARFRNADSNS